MTLLFYEKNFFCVLLVEAKNCINFDLFFNFFLFLTEISDMMDICAHAAHKQTQILKK